MSELSKIKEPVKKELKEFENHFKNSVKSNVPLLNIVMNYILRTKGKQIRPLIVMLTAKLHGNINQSTYTAASFIEILHTATLIHDDVIDESYERRGFFSINALWKSKVAVLLGDYLYSKGMLLSIENNEYDLLKIVSKAVKEIIEGELLQIQKTRKLNLTEKEYYEIIRKKTATLIAACCACGAYTTSSSQETIDKMWRFGESLGVAFQIKDDLLDYDKKSITGKPAGNDIKEKKLTLPLIYSLSKTTSSDNSKIRRIINKSKSNSKGMYEVIQFVRKNGGIDYAEKKMNEYKNKAIEILREYTPSDTVDSIKQLADFIIARSK